jgi:23S rRNA pseudouridine2605 synthase
MDKDKSKRRSYGKQGARAPGAPGKTSFGKTSPGKAFGKAAGKKLDPKRGQYRDHTHDPVKSAESRAKPAVKRHPPPRPPQNHAKAARPFSTESASAQQNLTQPAHIEGERIAKVMARAGLCSRRDAEVWIGEGRVSVNGKVLTSPAVSVLPDDEIKVDGQPLAQRERTRLFLFHKPRGLVTTNKDPEGRTTVFDYMEERHPDLPRLVSVGRLDINTEGLLLLTNDGGLARVLELPTTGWLRRYRVRANGETDQSILDRLREGVTIDGIHYAGIEATLDRVQGANNWMTIGLREGKNREIKRVLEDLGLAVNRLIRLSFGPFQLGELAEGAIEEVRTRVLRDQLGISLAQAAGADFDSEIAEAPAHVDAKPPMRRERPAGAPPGAPPRHGQRPHRARPEPEAEPPKVRSRPKPGPRKHVSALRGEEAEAAQQGRRRTLREETQDRNGRSVIVERRVAAVEPGKTRTSEPKRVKRKPPHGERAGAPPQREWRGERPHRDDERPARGSASFGNRPPRGDAPSGKRPPKSAGSSDERPARGAASFGKRPPRGDAPSGKRPPKSAGSSDERPARGAASFGKRPPRGDAPSGKRPPRNAAPSGERSPRGAAPSGQRPSRGGAPAGKRPPRGKP